MARLPRLIFWAIVGVMDGVVAGLILGFLVGFALNPEGDGIEESYLGAVVVGSLGAAVGIWVGWRFPSRSADIYVGLGVCGWLLVMLVAPAVHAVRDARLRSRGHEQLKQIGLALQTYHDHTKSFPPAVLPHDTLPPEKRLSWFVEMLPYLELKQVSESLDKTQAWDAEANREGVNTPIPLLHNPFRYREARETPNWTHFVGIAGVGSDAAQLPLHDPKAGIFGYNRKVTLQYIGVRDGTSNTMMVADTALNNGPWAAGGPSTVRGLDPNNQPYIGEGRQFGGSRPGSALVLFADGSVRMVTDSVNPRVFEALATIAGGEPNHGLD